MVSPDDQLKQQHIGEVDKQQGSEITHLSAAKVADASDSNLVKQEEMKDLAVANSSKGKDIPLPASKDQHNLKTLYGVNVQNYKNKIGYQFSSAEKTVDEFLNKKSADLKGKTTSNQNDISKDVMNDFPSSPDESMFDDFQGLLSKSGFSVSPNFGRLLGNESRMSLPKLGLMNKNSPFADYNAATHRDQTWSSCATSASTLKSPTFSMADISVVVPSYVQLTDNSREDVVTDHDLEDKSIGDANNKSSESIVNAGDGQICDQVENLTVSDCGNEEMDLSPPHSSDDASTSQSSSGCSIETSSASPCRSIHEEEAVATSNNTTISSIDCREESNLKIASEERSITDLNRSASQAPEENNITADALLKEEEKSVDDVTGSAESSSSFDFPDEYDIDDQFKNLSKAETEWQYVGATRSKQKRKQNRIQVNTKRSDRHQRRTAVAVPIPHANREFDKPISSKSSQHTQARTIPNRFLRAKAKQQNTSTSYRASYKDNKPPTPHSSVSRVVESTAVIWSKSISQTRASVKGDVGTLESNPGAPEQISESHLQLDNNSFNSTTNVQINGAPVTAAVSLQPEQSTFEDKSLQPIDTPVDPIVNGSEMSTASIEEDLRSILLRSNSVTDVKPKLEGEELIMHLKHQLEYYFSSENLAHDSYLRSQMDRDQWVLIWTIANFNAVKKLTSDLSLVIKALKASLLVEVDFAEEKVRPNQNLCAVILREIPDGVQKEEMTALFAGSSAELTSCNYAGNTNWYVIFQSEHDAQTAYRHLRENVRMFRGKPILARIKSKLQHLNAQTIPTSFPNTIDPIVTSNSHIPPQVTSQIDYLPPQQFVLCPPPIAAGGPLPGTMTASVPPFIPRVAAATNPGMNSTQPPGPAMAIGPPFGGFVLSHPWQATNLYPTPDPSLRPQFAGAFLPAFKPPAVPQYQLHNTSVANKPSNGPNQRYVDPQDGSQQNAYNQHKTTAVTYSQQQTQQLNIGAPSASQPQSYYILADPSQSNVAPDMIHYVPSDHPTAYVPHSAPNSMPVHYLPAVNRTPFVTPNANDSSIMVATPPPPLPQNLHYRSGKRSDPHMQQLVQPVYSATEQNGSSASNQRGRYPSPRSSTSSYHSEMNPRFLYKGNPAYPPLNAYNGPPFPQRSLTREHPSHEMKMSYASKSNNGYPANDQRGRNSPLPTPSEAYPSDPMRIHSVGNDFYSNHPSGDQHNQIKRHSFARRTASGPANANSSHNEQRNSYQAGFDRRNNMRQRRPRRPDEVHQMSYALANTSFQLESNSFPPLPGTSETVSANQSPENRSADGKRMDPIKMPVNEVPSPALPVKKYSEVSNASSASTKVIPVQTKHIQHPETIKHRETKPISAVNTQLVSDKSPPVVTKQPRQLSTGDKPHNEVVKQSNNVRADAPSTNRSSPSLVKPQPAVSNIPKEPEESKQNGTVKADSSPDSENTPNVQQDATEKTKEDIEHGEDDTALADGNDRKPTYAEMLKMKAAAAQLNGKDQSDSGGESRSGDEAKDLDSNTSEANGKPEAAHSGDENAPVKHERKDGRRRGNYEPRRGGSWQPRHYQDRNDDYRRFPRRDWGYERGNGPRDYRGRGGYRGRRMFRDNRPHNAPSPRPVSNGQVVVDR